jgi:hypothetical protein
MGEYTIDLSKYGWFPEYLPSEEADFNAEDSPERDGNESSDQ